TTLFCSTQVGSGRLPLLKVRLFVTHVTVAQRGVVYFPARQSSVRDVRFLKAPSFLSELLAFGLANGGQKGREIRVPAVMPVELYVAAKQHSRLAQGGNVVVVRKQDVQGRIAAFTQKPLCRRQQQ